MNDCCICEFLFGLLLSKENKMSYIINVRLHRILEYNSVIYKTFDIIYPNMKFHIQIMDKKEQFFFKRALARMHFRYQES